MSIPGLNIATTSPVLSPKKLTFNLKPIEMGSKTDSIKEEDQKISISDQSKSDEDDEDESSLEELDKINMN